MPPFVKTLFLGNVRNAALPGAILLLVMLMVVPIPAAMLDVFFVTNIAISLAVLMVALNAQKPLDFSAFPTVLLFATLFRLGLNVDKVRRESEVVEHRYDNLKFGTSVPYNF